MHITYLFEDDRRDRDDDWFDDIDIEIFSFKRKVHCWLRKAARKTNYWKRATTTQTTVKSYWMRSIRIDDTSGVTKIELKRESGPVITKKWQKAQYRNTSDLQDKMFPKNGKISNFANGHEKNQSAYIYYFERHKLERCDRFMKKTLNKRNLFLPNQNYCYKCLKAMKEGRNHWPVVHVKGILGNVSSRFDSKEDLWRTKSSSEDIWSLWTIWKHAELVYLLYIWLQCSIPRKIYHQENNTRSRLDRSNHCCYDNISWRKIVFLTNVEFMYYHSQVLKNQQSFLKLLCWENHEMEKEPQHCVMCAYVSGATSSDFCSRYTCVGQLQKMEMLQQVHHNFYVDDLVKPMNDFDSARYLAKDVISIYKLDGFSLLNSSSKKFLLSIPEHQRRLQMKNQDLYGYLLNENSLGSVGDKFRLQPSWICSTVSSWWKNNFAMNL